MPPVSPRSTAACTGHADAPTALYGSGSDAAAARASFVIFGDSASDENRASHASTWHRNHGSPTQITHHVIGRVWEQRRQLGAVTQRLLPWGPPDEIGRAGRLAAVVQQKAITLLRPQSTVDDTATLDPADLTIEGSFDQHEYTFARGDWTVATVSKQWFAPADTYGGEVADEEDDVRSLACAVVVDQAAGSKSGEAVSKVVVGGLSTVASAVFGR